MKEYIAELGAVHTDTGGYNSSTNPVEGAQGRLQQSARAMLAQCTGGHKYYIELRGAALKRAAYCINRTPRTSKGSAYLEAWGSEYNWDDPQEHVFGARCIYKTPSHSRDKMESVSAAGIWVGRDLRSNQHLVVPLAGYTPSSGECELASLISVRTVRVFEDQFPLRCRHTEG